MARSCYRGCPPIGLFIEAYLLVASSGIGAVAGDFLGVVLTLRVLSVSVTQAPKARRDAKTKHRRMDFFIPTFYCKQARRAMIVPNLVPVLIGARVPTSLYLASPVHRLEIFYSHGKF